MKKHYDFIGYATRYNVKCSDGLTIRNDAFKECDGVTVPLLWNHRHDTPMMVVGQAYLKHCADGVQAFCNFNDSDNGKQSREITKHRDIIGLSIYANKLATRAKEVYHGVIREVSLVLAPANKGALIDANSLEHDGLNDLENQVYWTDEPGMFVDLMHSDDGDEEVLYSYAIGDTYTGGIQHGVDLDLKGDGAMSKEEPTIVHADSETKKEDSAKDEDNETIEEIFNTLTDKQKNAVYAIVAAVTEDNDEDDDEDEDDDNGGKEVKHNAFYGGREEEVKALKHSELNNIIYNAKQNGLKLSTALSMYAEENSLSHDAVVSGFAQDPTVSGNISWLYPEFKDLYKEPELLTNDWNWVSSVINGVSKQPMTRVRVSYVDIRNVEGNHDDLRARGYQKGKEKKLMGEIALVRRTVDPQTITSKYSLHRDDIIDLQENGIEYVNYMYKISRGYLEEELALAYLVGDRRDLIDDDKILPAHIIPIWTDDEMFCIHRDMDVKAIEPTLNGANTGDRFGDSFVYAESLIETLMDARIDYRGNGPQTLFTTQPVYNKLMLARDSNGRRMYRTAAELEAELGVNKIQIVEQLTNLVRTDGQGRKHQLGCIVGNMANYTVGCAKGGEIVHLTDFDIDFNVQKSLLETRQSGMITRVKSFMCIEIPVTD